MIEGLVWLCLLCTSQIQLQDDGVVSQNEQADFVGIETSHQLPIPSATLRNPHLTPINHVKILGRRHTHHSDTANDERLESVQTISLDEHHSPFAPSSYLPIDPPDVAAAATDASAAATDAAAAVPVAPESVTKPTLSRTHKRANSENDDDDSDLGQLRSKLIQLMEKDNPATKDLEATQSTSSGCECTSTGMSGSVAVPHVGCGQHTDKEAAFCYVSNPEQCKDMSLESTIYPGARWRYCDVAPAAPMDPNTLMGHKQEDGYHKYTLQHSGVKTTLITEGNKTLSSAQGKKRSADLVKQVTEEQMKQRENITAAMNSTQAQTERAVADAMASVSEAMDGALDTLHSALKDAFSSTNATDTPNTPPPSFETLFNRIQGRVLAHTHHLRPPPLDKKGNVLSLSHRNETLFDRLMKMSDRIVHKVDATMDAVSKRVAEQASQQDSPVSVVAHTDE